ncbi:MAG: hypothetical protein IJ337_01275 [Clostridia bacterium]|nr:hypothetical protein [Clostridia bacterium]
MSKAQAALEAIKAMDNPIITPADIAPVLGVDAHSIRLQAAEDVGAMKFAVRVGNKTLISRLAFIRFVEGEPA